MDVYTHIPLDRQIEAQNKLPYFHGKPGDSSKKNTGQRRSKPRKQNPPKSKRSKPKPKNK